MGVELAGDALGADAVEIRHGVPCVLDARQARNVEEGLAQNEDDAGLLARFRLRQGLDPRPGVLEHELLLVRSGTSSSSPPSTTERQSPSSTPQRPLWAACVSCEVSRPEPRGA